MNDFYKCLIAIDALYDALDILGKAPDVNMPRLAQARIGCRTVETVITGLWRYITDAERSTLNHICALSTITLTRQKPTMFAVNRRLKATYDLTNQLLRNHAEFYNKTGLHMDVVSTDISSRWIGTNRFISDRKVD